MAEPFNKDVAVLAKKIFELTTLAPEALEARKWEALILLSAVYGSASPEGVAKANADKEARFGNQIRSEGWSAALHPKWHLRTDDGKPPVAQLALVSGLTNPYRDLRARLAALMHVPVDERPPLDDIVRAFVADAFAGATGDAKNAYLDAVRKRAPDWFKRPWLIVTPADGGLPPASILVESQGATHDGGIYDDPTDDTVAEQWRNSIRSWDVDFLRDNPAAQLFLGVEKVANAAGSAAEGIGAGLTGITSTLKHLPIIVGGVAAGAVVLGLGILSWTGHREVNRSSKGRD